MPIQTLLRSLPLCVFLTACSSTPRPVPPVTEPTLTGRAILPSDAYQPGPPSGAFITADNGVTVPFPGQVFPGIFTWADRLLTGADLDVESVRRMPNGDFWFGDEFGPFLLHTDSTGEVLDGERLLVTSDNNDPGNDGRWIARDKPDDTELIIVRVPPLRYTRGR